MGVYPINASEYLNKYFFKYSKNLLALLLKFFPCPQNIIFFLKNILLKNKNRRLTIEFKAWSMIIKSLLSNCKKIF